MKKGRKLFSTLQQTDISLSVSIKCRKIASQSTVIVWSIQPCFIEINSQKFFCASKSPNESDDNFLEKIKYIFEYQLTIEFADPFKNLWSLSGDKYSRLKIDTPYPINIENYISPPALCIRVEYSYREENQWKYYYREWNSNNYITKRQIDEATQFYQSL